MVELLKTLRFRVPKRKRVEAYIVRLDDGRVVARTKEELEEAGEGAGEKEEEKGE